MENEKENIPSETVTTIIQSLPKSEDEVNNSRLKTVRPSKRRKKRTASRNRLPKVIEESSDMADETKRRWVTTFANLALLLAIFTIVFAAHKGIQTASKVAVVEQQPTEVQSESTTVAIQEETKQSAVETEVAQQQPETVQQEVAAEAAAEIKTEEVAAAPKIEPKAKVKTPEINRAKVSYKDEFTSGGPLDLDRRASIPSTSTLTSSEQPSLDSTTPSPQVATDRHSDLKNPWNAGGHLDLDGVDIRQEYKKNNYISITESDK